MTKNDDDFDDQRFNEDDTLHEPTDFALPTIPSRRAQNLHEGSRLSIYIAGSRATEQFLKAMGITAFQIGVTGRRQVEHRLSDKRLRCYGSVLADPSDPEGTAIDLPLGGDVFLVRIDATMLEGVRIPTGLRIVDGVIAFTVKPGISVETVDKRISHALVGRSLNAFLATGDGQSRMTDIGHNPCSRIMTRYTDIGRKTRLSVAEEIFLIRPRRELQGLLDLVARTLADILVN